MTSVPPDPTGGTAGLHRAGSGNIRILVVDDHPMVRQGLVTFLSLSGDLSVVGEAGSVEEARAKLGSLDPDLVLLDLELPGASGLSLLADLARQRISDASETRRPYVLVLTSFGDPERVEEALRLGADGYLLKRVEPMDLANAIRQVAAGHLVLDPEAAGYLRGKGPAAVREANPLTSLTHREYEVLEHVAQGESNKEIAVALHVRERTVKGHMSAILGKLGVQDRTQAAVTFLRLIGPSRR